MRESIMKLNQLFTSHMVLPANREIRVFGEGAGKAEISFNGIVKTCNSTNKKELTQSFESALLFCSAAARVDVGIDPYGARNDYVKQALPK